MPKLAPAQRSVSLLTLRVCATSAAIALTIVVVAFPGKARANGRLPAGHQLVVSPSDPSYFVMETAFGILVSHDAGASWSWICESSVGYGFDGSVEDPT